MPERLSRRDRRIVERYNRKDSAKSLRPQSAVLKSLDEVLEQENDLRFLENELVSHRASLTFDRTLLFYLKSLSDLGVKESSLRVIFRDPLDDKKTFNILMNEALRFPTNSVPERLFGSLSRTKRVFKDEDHEEILAIIDTDTDIPVFDLLQEKVRVQKEDVELIDLQVKWLKQRNKPSRLLRKPDKQKESQNAIVEEENVTIQAAVVKDNNSKVEDETFSLHGRELFWTTTYFSPNPNHLIKLPTVSRGDALTALAEVSHGQISVKASSVLNSIEFYLQKNIIQKALAARAMYGPEGIRDWVKIKRGRDRIFILPDEKDGRIIFFAAGRDDVYSGI